MLLRPCTNDRLHFIQFKQSNLGVVLPATFAYRPRRRSKAPWRNGYAEDCKSLNGGSIPSGASNFPKFLLLEKSASMGRISRL